MTTPRFPAVDRGGKIQDAHLPSRLSESALVSLIQRESSGGGIPKPTTEAGLEMLAMKMAFGGAGQHTVAVVADSTMNDGNDSLRIFDRMYSAELSDTARHVYHNWNTSENGWRHTVNSEGDTTPGHDGTILRDNFNRTESDLVGSTPDVGAPWMGASDTWSSDGAVARASKLGVMSTDVGSKNMKLTAYMNVTTESTVAQQMRLYLGGVSPTAQTGYMVSVSVSATGALSILPYIASSSTSDRVGPSISGSMIGVTSNDPTSVTLKIEIEIDIQNVKTTVTGPNGVPVESAGLITEAQYGEIGTYLGIVAFSSTQTAFSFDSVEITTAPQPAVGDSLDVWNGAIAGGRWTTFNAAKLDQMFDGVAVDVLILSMGHNNGAQSGDDFVAETEAWVDLWMSKHPETQGIVWVSQNPQFPPASAPAFHRDRQMAMRLAAKQNGWEYVAGYEGFSTQPDGGQSLVGADGIHPTTPPVGVLVGDYGAVLVADAILSAVHARI